MRARQLLGRSLAIALTWVAATGCVTDPLNREDTFREQQKQFTQYIRWGKFDAAAAFVVEEQRAEFAALAPQLSDIRFTDYDLLHVELRDSSHGTAEVLFTGYRLSSPISRTMLVKQDWKRDGFDGWRVTLELEPLREALGLAAK